MNQEIKKNIEILVRKYKSGKFLEVINDAIVLLKKDNNDYLWNILGLCHQNLNSYKNQLNVLTIQNINPQNITYQQHWYFI